MTRGTSDELVRLTAESSTLHTATHDDVLTLVAIVPLRSILLFVLMFVTVELELVIANAGESPIRTTTSTNALDVRVVLSVTVTVNLDVVFVARLDAPKVRRGETELNPPDVITFNGQSGLYDGETRTQLHAKRSPALVPLTPTLSPS